MGFYGGPLRGDDAVDASVAQGGVGHDLMAAHDPIELGAETLDAATALLIEEVRTEFHGDAVERFKSVGEE